MLMDSWENDVLFHIVPVLGARKYSCIVSYVAVHGHSRTRYRNEKLNQGNASEKLLLQLIYKH
jgi:hypothetical protein